MVYTSEYKSLFIFQLLGECHCRWTSECPRADVAKFYGRLRLIRSVLRASRFSVLKLIKIVILWVYLAKDHWRGFITRHAHMVHIVNQTWVKMVYTSEYKSLFIFQLLDECHCLRTTESPRTCVAMFFGRLLLIRSV